MKYQIAIDGPSGVGKSTVAKKISQSLNFLYVNTGLLFRAVAYYYHLNNDKDLKEIANSLSNQNLLQYVNGEIFLQEKNITNKLKNSDISKTASIISQDANIRNYILQLEKKVALNENVVMEGRDIGTIVFPNATLKIFLTASIFVRAKRRYEELKKLNLIDDKVSIATIEVEIAERDKQDEQRALAPLIKAKDAFEINTDNLGVEEIILEIKQLFLKKIKFSH